MQGNTENYIKRFNKIQERFILAEKSSGDGIIALSDESGNIWY